MGKTNQPLHIAVAVEWEDHPKINELREKGHTVTVVEEGRPNPDLILHPNAWRWHDGQWDNLEVAIKEARKGQPKRRDAKAGDKPRRRKGPKGSGAE